MQIRDHGDGQRDEAAHVVLESALYLPRRELVPFLAQVCDYSGQRHPSRQTVADGRGPTISGDCLFSIPLGFFFFFKYLLYLVFHDCALSQVMATTRVPGVVTKVFPQWAQHQRTEIESISPGLYVLSPPVNSAKLMYIQYCEKNKKNK